MENTISIILTVYNQENLIQQVFSGIAENVSEYTKEIIVIIDGCTDKTEENLERVLTKAKTDIKIIYTPDLNEVKCNNIGFKNSVCNYSIIVQDDCVVTEKYFDARLLKPFKVVPNLLGVTARTAEDTRIENGELRFYNTVGTDVHTPRNIFGIRDAVNRGPLMLDNYKLKQLNYLDEDFAPLNQDDTDLCIRAYKEFKYLVGAYVAGYISEGIWGKTRHDPISAAKYDRAQREHLQMIIDRHSDFINAPKHSQDIIIPE